MLSKIFAIFAVIKELIALIKLLLSWVEAQKREEAKRKEGEREKAAQDLKNAQTEEEFNNASDRLHGNSN